MYREVTFKICFATVVHIQVTQKNSFISEFQVLVTKMFNLGVNRI